MILLDVLTPLTPQLPSLAELQHRSSGDPSSRSAAPSKGHLLPYYFYPTAAICSIREPLPWLTWRLAGMNEVAEMLRSKEFTRVKIEVEGNARVVELKELINGGLASLVDYWTWNITTMPTFKCLFLALFIALSFCGGKATRNLLQLPNLPSLPNLPKPTLPPLASIPTLPQPTLPTTQTSLRKPTLPPLPAIPSMPTLPTAPKVTLPPLSSMPSIPTIPIPTTFPSIPFLSPPPATTKP
ncbi:hypothetical protein SADUNF_Sadunf17G0043700 [Salix dunnii]|uniref:Uncharacterized protein n=1 Tax=Salix dunnii TaxID=1413687 RepID=A0A835MH25_9ROSI|nr:hypothetical protein SADUNF_Sadunf17G0043700 [Salix dunnii]